MSKFQESIEPRYRSALDSLDTPRYYSNRTGPELFSSDHCSPPPKSLGGDRMATERKNESVRARSQSVDVSAHREEIVLFPLAPEIRAALENSIGRAVIERLYITAPQVKSSRCGYNRGLGRVKGWIG